MAPATSEETEIKPLSARSSILSLMLGAHPGAMSSAQISRAGVHFGIPAATVRVALTRAVAAGDLERDADGYRLGERLTARQRRQDEGVLDVERPWDGSWEMAIVVVAGRSGVERAELRNRLAEARLGELREGVWARPANLRRPASYVGDPVLRCFTAIATDDPRGMANALWDLESWAGRGRDLVASFDSIADPAVRLATAARIVRHLSADPLVPATLLPDGWPGHALRAAYADYRRELRDLSLT